MNVSVYDLAAQTQRKCGSRFDPLQYALVMLKYAETEEHIEQWVGVAEILRGWQKTPH